MKRKGVEAKEVGGRRRRLTGEREYHGSSHDMLTVRQWERRSTLRQPPKRQRPARRGKSRLGAQVQPDPILGALSEHSHQVLGQQRTQAVGSEREALPKLLFPSTGTEEGIRDNASSLRNHTKLALTLAESICMSPIT